MTQKKILIAGATGYLGQFLVTESKKQGYWVRALTRDAKKLARLDNYIDDMFIGEITKPESLDGICDNIDFVISTIGITHQKDNLTYMDVDYQGNRNLLDCAMKSKVCRFAYVSALNAHLLMDLKIAQAKEKFAGELKESGLDHIILRPSGFFSDMLYFLKMAYKGKVSLFGIGDCKINPIHGEDLAEICVAALSKDEKEIEIGGPEIFSHFQIAEMAFNVLQREAKISYMPLWMMSIIIRFMRIFTSSKTYGPVEFMMSALTMDMVGPTCGKRKLREFYESRVEKE